MSPSTPTITLNWDGASALRLGTRYGISDDELNALRSRLTRIHAEIQRERRLPSEVVEPSWKTDTPYHYGFMDWPARWLGEQRAELDRLRETADRLAADADTFVVLGIGGSYLGARALFDALCHRYHNELPREARGNRPRVYFEGNNVDSDALSDLLDLLDRIDGDGPAGRAALNVISKSGTTLETEVVFNIVQARLREKLGDAYSGLVAATTGQSGVLRQASEAAGFRTFEVPDDVGGRYSVFTAVGLLPAAVFGVDLEALLQGAADFQAWFDTHEDPETNPGVLYAALQHLAYEKGLDVRVLAAWTHRLESVGYWYDQLYAESLGKQEEGATPLTIVGTRELHSRQQEHQQGPRDKIFTNLVVVEPGRNVPVPELEGDPERSGWVQGRQLHELSHAAMRGTNASLHADRRPTMDLHLPRVDAYQMGALLQLFMNATIVEGKLVGIWPFGQPGVEGYKKQMQAELRR